MNIRVDLNTPINDGTEVVFRSPVDCSQVTGLIVYYDGGSQEFMFADAHGFNVGDIDHLFAENVVVKVILDVTASMAFVQNADTNAYLEWRFKDTIDKCCPSIAESGSVVTCAPVEGYPLGVVSKIEPVQQGEGDPSPSITGDSVVLDVSVDDESTAWIYPEGLQASTTYKLTINTSVAPASISVYNVESGDSLLEDSNEFSAVFTTKDATDVRIVMNWDRPKPAHEEGITPYIVQPYTPGNIRPITGHTAVKLWRGGKNLFDFKQDVKLVDLASTTTNQRYGHELHLPAGTYTVSAVAHTTETRYLYSRIKYANGTYSTTTSIVAGTNYKPCTYKLSQGEALIIYNGSSITGALGGESASNTMFKENFDVQIEAGSVATAYEPYRGEEFTCQLGQTVYGGSYDWAIGVLTVDKAFLTLSGATKFNFNNVTGNISQFYYKFPTEAERAVIGEACVCSHYAGSADDAYNGKIDKTISAIASNLWLCDSRFSSAKEFNDYLAEQYANGTPVQVAYPLTTPVTVHLTTQEILALSGTNTLYSDTGDTQVSGRADPNAVIQDLYNKLNALSATMTALTGV